MLNYSQRSCSSVQYRSKHGPKQEFFIPINSSVREDFRRRMIPESQLLHIVELSSRKYKYFIYFGGPNRSASARVRIYGAFVLRIKSNVFPVN